MNRSVLITGTSSGIGLATSIQLAGSGWTVFGTVRDEAAADRLKNEGDAITPVYCEMGDLESIHACVAEVAQRCGGTLDALINNAAMVALFPLELADDDLDRELINVNLRGPIRLIRACLPLLRTARSPRILNIGSFESHLPTVGAGFYAATKAGLRSISGALRMELRPWGIQVTYLALGAVDTPAAPKSFEYFELIRAKVPPHLPEYLEVMNPDWSRKFARWRGTPEETARTIERIVDQSRLRPHYYIGKDAKFAALISSLLPTSTFEMVKGKWLGIPTGRLKSRQATEAPKP